MEIIMVQIIFITLFTIVFCLVIKLSRKLIACLPFKSIMKCITLKRPSKSVTTDSAICESNSSCSVVNGSMPSDNVEEEDVEDSDDEASLEDRSEEHDINCSRSGRNIISLEGLDLLSTEHSYEDQPSINFNCDINQIDVDVPDESDRRSEVDWLASEAEQKIDKLMEEVMSHEREIDCFDEFHPSIRHLYYEYNEKYIRCKIQVSDLDCGGNHDLRELKKDAVMYIEACQDKLKKKA